MLPILYSFRRCPYAMRARLALLASATTCELREVTLSAKPAALLAASPQATVPVLVLPDGTVIAQSLDIMRWASCRSDPGGWLHADDAALIALNDGAFKRDLDGYKYADRTGGDAIGARDAGLAFLYRLDLRLANHGSLGSMGPGPADWAIFPFVRQFAAVDPAWFDRQPLPRLQAWLAKHLQSPSFAAIMTKYAVWKPHDFPVLFGGSRP